MTVKELKAELEKYPDDMCVTIKDEAYGYLEIFVRRQIAPYSDYNWNSGEEILVL